MIVVVNKSNKVFFPTAKLFKRHRGRVPFDIEKHNSMETACKHLIEFMGIKQQAEKFGLGSFDLKLTDLKVTKKVILK